MRILQLTPGTGSFLCGSCLRDNALSRELRGRGHDVLISPLYLPFFLEEQEGHPHAAAPHDAVHMGGINVYLQQKVPLLRALPRFVHDLLDRPGLLRFAAARASMTDASGLGALTLSMLRGEEGRQAAELDRLIEWMGHLERPDVVVLSNAMLLGLARRIGAELDLPVLCTLQGEPPFLDALPEPYRTDCWSTLRERAGDATGFIAVSRYTADLMCARMGAPRERVHVVPNGIELSDFAGVDALGAADGAASSARPPTIGYLARMCPDKGLHELVGGFLALRARGTLPGVRLRVAGVRLHEDRAYVRELERRVAAAGASDAVEFLPDVSLEEKRALLGSLSVLSVPARYGESFGLYVLEALACGVPVVQPRVAAFPEIVDATGGGLTYEADERGAEAALADALEALLLDEPRRRELALRGRSSVHAEFGADRMARDIERVCAVALEAHRASRT